MKKISLLLLLFTSVALHAQTGGGKGNLGNEDINIVKEYTPVLNDAFKINIQPDQDTSKFIALGWLKYNVDDKPMNSAFNTRPIKPVRIKDDAMRKLYHGFVKAGYGLENMPLLDVSFNSLRSKNFDAGFRFKHLSASGKIKNYGHPGMSNNDLGVFGTRYFDKFKLGANLDFNRNLVHFYGFQSPPELFSKSETKHSMNDLHGRVFLSSLNKSKDDWQYSTALDFYNFSDNRKANETNVKFEAEGSKLMNNAMFSMYASFEGGEIKQELFNFNRSIFRLRPKFVLRENLYTLEAGANLAFETNNGKNDLRIYPQVRGEYQIIDDAFKVYGEVSGDLQRNDLRSFSRENPFFGTFVPLVNTNRKLSIIGGANIKLEHDLMFAGEASYSRLRNLPFFINGYDSLYPVTFSTVYDQVNLLRIKGSLEYKQAEKVTAAISAEYNNYKTDQLKEALYAPTFRFGFNGHYNIADKIYLKADIIYNAGINGIAYTKSDSLVTSSSKELKGWLDASLGVDYRYSKVLSIFVQLNNVAFAQYFRWYEYPSYRFLGMAGLTYSF